MTDDLPTRLRAAAHSWDVEMMEEILAEAADALDKRNAEIERLRAEVVSWKREAMHHADRARKGGQDE